MNDYDHQKIEKKWQDRWEESKINSTDFENSEKPFYNLMMFPYPSAEGLHIGSVYTFSGIDTYGRFKKMQGHEVFEPFGLDGFGIHSENYAIKIGEHIRDVSKRTEKHFYEQVKMTGNMIDWDKKVETYKEDYYKWTQWLFTMLFKKGLAYRKNANVNWCPSCKTVLSDEQVEDGECERCGSEVRQKELTQWFFKITEYSERLLKNLDWIDWDEAVTRGQRNWIGKKTGINITYPIMSGLNDTKENLFENIIMDIDNSREDVSNKEYKTACRIVVKNKKGEVLLMKRNEEHQKGTWDLPGGSINMENFEEGVVSELVEETGLKNNYSDLKFLFSYDGYTPEFDQTLRFFCFELIINDEEIELSDEHSEFKFVTDDIAQKELYWEGHKRAVEYSFNKYDIDVFTTRPDTNFGATFIVVAPEHELVDKIINREISTDEDLESISKYVEKSINKTDLERISEGKNKTGVFTGLYAYNNLNGKRLPIYVSDFVLANFGTGAVVGVPAHDLRDFQFAQKFNLDVIRVVAVNGDDSDITSEEQVQEEEGIMINSEFLDGLDIHEATKKMMDHLEEKGWGRRVVNYNLRDWVVSRQRYWGPPIPMIFDKDFEDSSKPRVMIIHGIYGKGSENWFPWIVEQFEAQGIESVNPDFPNPSKPELSTWLEKISEYNIEREDVIFAHSLGCFAALKYAEKNQIRELVLIAPTNTGDDAYWEEQKSSLPDFPVDYLRENFYKDLDTDAIKNNVEKITFIFSEDDPYITSSIRDQYRSQFPEADFEIYKYKGHFGSATNTREIPELLKHVSRIASIGWRKVETKDLPVSLPDITDFDDILPDGSGKGPLQKQEGFVNELDGFIRETDVSDPFVDSCWYFLRYPFVGDDENPFEFVKRANLGSQIEQDKSFVKMFFEIYDHFESEDLRPMISGSIAVSAINGHAFKEIKDMVFAFTNQHHAKVAINILEKRGWVKNNNEKNDVIVMKNENDEIHIIYKGLEGSYLGYKVRFEGKKIRVIDPRILRKSYDDFGRDDDKYLDIKKQILDHWINQKINKWFPVHSYIGGKEHTVLHLLYARFITMVLNDLDLIDFEEPFEKFYGHGLITKDGAKMSKSKGNVINPDEYFGRYGADSVRMYLRFLGPFDQGGDWRDTGMNGMRKFVVRLWEIFDDYVKISESLYHNTMKGEDNNDKVQLGSGVKDISMLHKTIKNVGADIDSLRFNTAVAKIMEFVNWYKDQKENFDKEQLDEIIFTLNLIIAPLMPHLAEEFWEKINTAKNSSWTWSEANSVHNQSWPMFDEKQLISDEVVIVVQVNGKTRGTYKFAKGSSQKEIEEFLKNEERITKYNIVDAKKIIYIPDKIINFIV